jgi:hypothetical protein
LPKGESKCVGISKGTMGANLGDISSKCATLGDNNVPSPRFVPKNVPNPCIGITI